MSTVTQIPRFNALAAYEAEREENRRLFALLNNVLFVADGLANRLDRYGADTSNARAVIAQARAERFEDVAA